mgnify:CR=1 FL=1
MLAIVLATQLEIACCSALHSSFAPFLLQTPRLFSSFPQPAANARQLQRAWVSESQSGIREMRAFSLTSRETGVGGEENHHHFFDGLVALWWNCSRFAIADLCSIWHDLTSCRMLSHFAIRNSRPSRRTFFNSSNIVWGVTCQSSRWCVGFFSRILRYQSVPNSSR